jgi:hypothetical protein
MSDDDLAMGFNRRKVKYERRRAAEKEAASRCATDAQVLKDAERLIAAWNERQSKRMAMLFPPTIGAAICSPLLVLVGPLSGLPNHQRDRLAHSRPSPQRGRDQSHSRVILPVLPAKRPVRRARAAVADQHRR